MSSYKISPTWLFKDGKTKLFNTQSEVDQAWENGWNDGAKTVNEKKDPSPSQSPKSKKAKK